MVMLGVLGIIGSRILGVVLRGYFKKGADPLATTI